MAVLKKTETARYLCRDCYGKKGAPVRRRARCFRLTSSAFASLFIGADVVPMDVLTEMVNEAARRYEAIMPCRRTRRAAAEPWL